MICVDFDDSDEMRVEGLNQKPMFIIADDLTGANEVGVAFAEAGFRVAVLLEPSAWYEPENDADVYVICTDSRDFRPSVAFESVRNLCHQLQLGQHQHPLIKKVDSTLRGNVGSELAALFRSGYEIAIVAIAVPGAKRKTCAGICYVNDIPLADTEFATDPKSPVCSSRVLEIIRAQLDERCDALQLCEFSSPELNVDVLMRQFQALHARGERIIICDAESDRDLCRLYQAAERLPLASVFMSTGALSQALLTIEPERPMALPRSTAPVLAIVGSMSEVTFRQVNVLMDATLSVCIEPEMTLLLNDRENHYLKAIVKQVKAALAQGRHCVVRSCGDPQQRYQLADFCRQYHFNAVQLSERVRDFLAAIPAQVFQHQANALPIGGLILCGGDIAIAGARQMGASVFSLQGQFNCMPWGYLLRSGVPCPVLTKAGGFGEESVFLKLIQYLHKEV